MEIPNTARAPLLAASGPARLSSFSAQHCSPVMLAAAQALADRLTKTARPTEFHSSCRHQLSKVTVQGPWQGFAAHCVLSQWYCQLAEPHPLAAPHTVACCASPAWSAADCLSDTAALQLQAVAYKLRASIVARHCSLMKDLHHLLLFCTLLRLLFLL